VILGATILNLSPVWNVRARHRQPVARKFKRRGGWIGYGVHCWLVTAFKGCLPAWKDHNLSRGVLGLPWLENCAHLFCSANWRRQVLNARYVTKLQKNEPFATREWYFIYIYIYTLCYIWCGLLCGMRMICEICVKIILKKSLLSGFFFSNIFPFDTVGIVYSNIVSLRYAWRLYSKGFPFHSDARKIRFFIVRIYPRNNRSLNHRAWLTPFTFHSRRKPHVSFVENNRAILVHKCILQFDGDSIEMIQCFSFGFRKKKVYVILFIYFQI